MTNSFGFDEQDLKQHPTERIEELMNMVQEENTSDPEEIMLMIMEVFNQTVTPIPEVGGFYTFVYNAKTPKITYDQHPLIACVDLFSWGFRGLNFHWQKYRNYTWSELAGQLYIVEYQELDELLSLQYGKFRLNN
jgi:hypothetical protein|tara:strand:- start:2380 stop:2784 length:405 start_codon:yes stop_codon:yes gene_type:complete